MTIYMTNGEKEKTTYTCSLCESEGKIMFACNRCHQLVCMYCGFLLQKGSFYKLVNNVTQETKVDSKKEMGLNEWLDHTDNEEQYICEDCR